MRGLLDTRDVKRNPVPGKKDWRGGERVIFFRYGLSNFYRKG